MCVCAHVCARMFLFLSGKFLEEGLGHQVDVNLTIVRNFQMFPKVVVSCYTHRV